MKKITVLILALFVFVFCLSAESEMFVLQEKDEWGDPTGDYKLVINSESAIYRNSSGEEIKLSVQMTVYPATHKIELGIYDLKGKGYSPSFETYTPSRNSSEKYLSNVRYRFGSDKTVYTASEMHNPKYSNVYKAESYDFLIGLLQSGNLRILINNPTKLDVSFSCDRDKLNSLLKQCNSDILLNDTGTGLRIADGVTSIDSYAFSYWWSLTSIEIPASVTSIGEYAFYFCSSLTSIEIPASVTSIGEYAFYGCSSLTNVEIANRDTFISSTAFSGCGSLTSIKVDGVSREIK